MLLHLPPLHPPCCFTGTPQMPHSLGNNIYYDTTTCSEAEGVNNSNRSSYSLPPLSDDLLLLLIYSIIKKGLCSSLDGLWGTK